VPIHVLSIYNVGETYSLFSPNDDGEKDITTISSSITVRSNWTITIKDAFDAIVRTESGLGHIISWDWNGNDASEMLVLDGDYTYQIKVTEPSSGVMAFSEIRPITVDTTLPITEIASPVDSQIVYETVILIGTVSDINDIDSYLIEYGLGPDPVTWQTIRAV